MDAVQAMMPRLTASSKYFYVIEGDIKSYFDTVQHRKLLSILKRRIADRDIIDLIGKFLKSGVMEDGLFERTESGVPQGGVISPLLANVYLHQLDTWAAAKWSNARNVREQNRKLGRGNYILIRFADDFVIISNDRIAGVREAKQELKEFIDKELHLTLSEEKTALTHINDGITFLGFSIRRVISRGKRVVHIRPSQKAKEQIKAKIKEVTGRNDTDRSEYSKLTELNTIVSGWAEYYRHTSLLEDIIEISRFTMNRYYLWLHKKRKGIPVRQLLTSRRKVIFKTKRWVAETRQGNKRLFTFQWQPTRRELRRQRYLLKGKDGFPHPYLPEDCQNNTRERRMR